MSNCCWAVGLILWAPVLHKVGMSCVTFTATVPVLWLLDLGSDAMPERNIETNMQL